MAKNSIEWRETEPSVGAADARTGVPGSAEAHVHELEAEIARLRARVAALESAPSGAREPESGQLAGMDVQRFSEQYLTALINHAPNLIFIKDINHRYAVVNERVASYMHRTPSGMIGCSEMDLFPPEIASKLISEEEQVIASGKPLEYEEELNTELGKCYFYTVKFPIYGANGEVLGVGAFISDISELKRADAERLDLKEQVIRAQQAALRELSTPLIPLAEGILAMPIVGTIDSVRANEILETLLQGINQRGAHTAILDITGVHLVDTHVANALVGAARAARLLGARVVLTGISPAVAKTLVQLETSLDGIVTMGTLASGIHYALKAQTDRK
jgi:PAS domain S-box-containing protein